MNVNNNMHNRYIGDPNFQLDEKEEDKHEDNQHVQQRFSFFNSNPSNKAVVSPNSKRGNFFSKLNLNLFNHKPNISSDEKIDAPDENSYMHFIIDNQQILKIFERAYIKNIKQMIETGILSLHNCKKNFFTYANNVAFHVYGINPLTLQIHAYLVNALECFHEQNFKGGFRIIEDQAKIHNNPFAMVNLVCCYLNGIGTEKNYNQAYFWSKMAGELGQPEGLFYLSICFKEGIGTNQDFNEYTKTLQQAYIAKSCYAALEIALAHYYGANGFDKNLTKTLELLEKIKALEFAEAMIAHARIISNQESPKDEELEKIPALYNQAAESGDPTALYLLADYFKHSRNKAEVLTTFSLITVAAYLGYNPAQNRLGNYFRDKISVLGGMHNSKQALIHYLNAASQGNVTAMETIIKSYRNHDLSIDARSKHLYQDIPPNSNSIVFWYRQIAWAYIIGNQNIKLTDLIFQIFNYAHLDDFNKYKEEFMSINGQFDYKNLFSMDNNVYDWKKLFLLFKIVCGLTVKYGSLENTVKEKFAEDIVSCADFENKMDVIALKSNGVINFVGDPFTFALYLITTFDNPKCAKDKTLLNPMSKTPIEFWLGTNDENGVPPAYDTSKPI